MPTLEIKTCSDCPCFHRAGRDEEYLACGLIDCVNEDKQDDIYVDAWSTVAENCPLRQGAVTLSLDDVVGG